MSSGVPKRFSGDRVAMVCSSSSDLLSSHCSVAVAPGATQLTVMFWPLSSLQRTRVKTSTALFAAL